MGRGFEALGTSPADLLSRSRRNVGLDMSFFKQFPILTGLIIFTCVQITAVIVVVLVNIVELKDMSAGLATVLTGFVGILSWLLNLAAKLKDYNNEV